jgi:hypothetical protein
MHNRIHSPIIKTLHLIFSLQNHSVWNDKCLASEDIKFQICLARLYPYLLQIIIIVILISYKSSIYNWFNNFKDCWEFVECLCGLVVSLWLQIQRSGFDSRRYQIFWEVVGLERGPLSLVSTIEEVLERKSNSYGICKRDYGCKGSAVLTTQHPSIRKSWH